MGLTWEEAEVAALNRQEWRRNVAQCVHLDAGRIKYQVLYMCFLIPELYQPSLWLQNIDKLFLQRR